MVKFDAANLEYKYIKCDVVGDQISKIEWEKGENRKLDLIGYFTEFMQKQHQFASDYCINIEDAGFNDKSLGWPKITEYSGLRVSSNARNSKPIHTPIYVEEEASTPQFSNESNEGRNKRKVATVVNPPQDVTGFGFGMSNDDKSSNNVVSKNDKLDNTPISMDISQGPFDIAAQGIPPGQRMSNITIEDQKGMRISPIR